MGKDGELLCSYSTNRNEMWISLIEKAYMKVQWTLVPVETSVALADKLNTGVCQLKIPFGDRVLHEQNELSQYHLWVSNIVVISIFLASSLLFWCFLLICLSSLLLTLVSLYVTCVFCLYRLWVGTIFPDQTRWVLWCSCASVLFVCLFVCLFACLIVFVWSD